MFVQIIIWRIDLRKTLVVDNHDLARTAADYFIELAQAAYQENKPFAVALSGGSTPKAVYQLLAESPLEWKNIHLFWGDERCVPPDYPDSNYRMTVDSLISHIHIPPQNIHRICGELAPEEAAESYEHELRTYFGEVAHFDLVLLGLGEDGHTASLFPNSFALEERSRWAVAVPHNVPPLPLVPRVTLTLPILNNARHVVFLVSGAAKSARLAEVLRSPIKSPSLPATLVQPTDGELVWIMDRSAAGDIEK